MPVAHCIVGTWTAPAGPTRLLGLAGFVSAYEQGSRVVVIVMIGMIGVVRTIGMAGVVGVAPMVMAVAIVMIGVPADRCADHRYEDRTQACRK